MSVVDGKKRETRAQLPFLPTVSLPVPRVTVDSSWCESTRRCASVARRFKVFDCLFAHATALREWCHREFSRNMVFQLCEKEPKVGGGFIDGSETYGPISVGSNAPSRERMSWLLIWYWVLSQSLQALASQIANLWHRIM